jgi:hypothetical protein
MTGMSDSVLSVVPTDPWWQPGPDDGRAAGDLVASLTLVQGDTGWCEVEWLEGVRLVDCGENLERIGCPQCGRELTADWFRDELDQLFAADGSCTSLDVVMPCCATATTFNDLDYDWPMAFASFEIAVWNGSRPLEPGSNGLLDPEATAKVEQVLGHAVRQVRAHI